MKGRDLTPEDAAEDAKLFRECARNMSETARRKGVTRATMQGRIRHAKACGAIEEWELHEPNPGGCEDYMEARAAKIRAYEQKKRKGDWRKPVQINLPSGPCMLIVMGDPHIDADGTNFELFERTWQRMEPGCFGICVGDWFDNWTRALAHLYAEQTIRPSDGWTLLEHLMQTHGEHLIAACSGNHDDWSHGPIDPVAHLMRRHGVVYRRGAVRVALRLGEEVITAAIRHKWRGQSMYSAAHWAARATRDGWWDHLMVGGHIHQDEDRTFPRKPDGFIAHAVQVSAFKEYDDHVDVQGYMGPRIAPVRYVVIDPSRPDSCPDKLTVRYDYDRAMGDLEALKCHP